MDNKTQKNCICFERLVSNLKSPMSWMSNVTLTPKLIISVLLYFFGGIILNYSYAFPHFFVFVGLFSFILFLSVISERNYFRSIQDIMCSIDQLEDSRQANYFMRTKGTTSTVYIAIPAIVILIFGIGGCRMFGALQVTPTLCWILSLFVVTVYFSIIGYLQYCFLAFYIWILAKGKNYFRRLDKSITNYIPADVSWIRQLTKLSHTYRSAFFTLGCVYILSFSAFCYLPDFNTNLHSIDFLLLWGIIFVAIVLLFPIVSVLEYCWIKDIVTRAKESFIQDLHEECNILSCGKSSPLTYMVESICARQILNSKDYPIQSWWTVSYAITLSVLNLFASIATIMDGMGPIINVLRQIA